MKRIKKKQIYLNKNVLNTKINNIQLHQVHYIINKYMEMTLTVLFSYHYNVLKDVVPMQIMF